MKLRTLDGIEDDPNSGVTAIPTVLQEYLEPSRAPRRKTYPIVQEAIQMAKPNLTVVDSWEGLVLGIAQA